MLAVMWLSLKATQTMQGTETMAKSGNMNLVGDASFQTIDGEFFLTGIRATTKPHGDVTKGNLTAGPDNRSYSCGGKRR